MTPCFYGDAGPQAILPCTPPLLPPQALGRVEIAGGSKSGRIPLAHSVPQLLGFWTFSPFDLLHPLPHPPYASEVNVCHAVSGCPSLSAPRLLSQPPLTLNTPGRLPCELPALTFLSVNTFLLHCPRIQPRTLISTILLPASQPSWLCLPWCLSVFCLLPLGAASWYFVAIGPMSHSWQLTPAGPHSCLATLVSHKLAPPNDCGSNLPTFLFSKAPSLLKSVTEKMSVGMSTVPSSDPKPG